MKNWNNYNIKNKDIINLLEMQGHACGYGCEMVSFVASVSAFRAFCTHPLCADNGHRHCSQDDNNANDLHEAAMFV